VSHRSSLIRGAGPWIRRYSKPFLHDRFQALATVAHHRSILLTQNLRTSEAYTRRRSSRNLGPKVSHPIQRSLDLWSMTEENKVASFFLFAEVAAPPLHLIDTRKKIYTYSIYQTVVAEFLDVELCVNFAPVSESMRRSISRMILGRHCGCIGFD
jgi:hypothetical protein